MKNILVTGSLGQLGRELQRCADPALGKFHFHDVDTLDITNMSSLRQFFTGTPVDVIINCAAYTAVDKAETDKEMALKINAEAVQNLLEANEHRARFIHISTDFVFDGTAHLPYKEDDRTAPINYYGETKLKGEEIVVRSTENFVILRTSWLYSEFGNNFVKTMLRLGAERPELKVIFDQIGTPTYASDLAKVIISLIDKDEVRGIFHYSNEGVASWYDFTKEILSSRNISSSVIPITTAEYPTPARRPHYSVLNKGKIKEALGITIPHWKESLSECLKRLD